MIYFLAASIVAAVFLGALTTATGLFAVNEKRVRLLACLLWISAAAGLVGAAVSTAVFYISAGAGAESDAVRDAYTMFLVSDGAAALVCLAVTLSASLTKSRLKTVRKLLSALFAVLTLMWTALCMLWSEYDSINASSYICITGICLAAVLAASPAADMTALAKALSNEKGLRERKEKLAKRAQKKRARQTLREKRRDLSKKH